MVLFSMTARNERVSVGLGLIPMNQATRILKIFAHESNWKKQKEAFMEYGSFIPSDRLVRRGAKTLAVILLLSLLSLTLSCVLIGSDTKVAKTTPLTSVLVPASLLHPPKVKGYAELIYAAPDVDWKSYTKILLDPVTFWRGKESKLNSLSQKNAQLLTNYFYSVIYDTLSIQYEMVSKPGPDTLRVTVALTKVQESDVIPDVVSTIVPQLRLLTTIVDFATDKPVFSGEAAVESRITDSETGRILAAGIDQRVGNRKITSKSLSSWGDVENIMKFWAQRATYNLCEQQKRSDCVKPKR